MLAFTSLGGNDSVIDSLRSGKGISTFDGDEADRVLSGDNFLLDSDGVWLFCPIAFTPEFNCEESLCSCCLLVDDTVVSVTSAIDSNGPLVVLMIPGFNCDGRFSPLLRFSGNDDRKIVEGAGSFVVTCICALFLYKFICYSDNFMGQCSSVLMLLSSSIMGYKLN